MSWDRKHDVDRDNANTNDSYPDTGNMTLIELMLTRMTDVQIQET